ncbi:MAG: CinA family protein [Tenacibaculum sp.]|nr:CinA family protein [Tenacibaculum sp.]
MNDKETIVLVGELLKSKGLTVSTAESMTGGKLASTIVSVAGASQYYKGSFITYSADLKQKLLGVPKEVIDKYSVVSKEVAEIMASLVKEKTETDFGISVTGNAGPTTDVNTKDVGLVFIGIASKKGVNVFKLNFNEPREKVINLTVIKALELLKQEI